MIIDTHCHYNLPPLVTDWQDHWDEAKAHTVQAAMVVGTAIETSKTAVMLTQQNQSFLAAVGIHPNEPVITESVAQTLEHYKQQIAQLASLTNEEKVVAIGECGLDYFRLEEQKSEYQQVQKYLLEQQLLLAQEKNVPVIIHLRDKTEDAYWDFLEIYKSLHTKKAFTQPFVLHCVSGPTAFVKQALELGAYIGVAGNVTYKNADAIRELVKLAPTDRILVETDAPYLPPMPHRGKTCEPWMVELTTTFVCQLTGLTQDAILENTRRIFPAFETLSD